MTLLYKRFVLLGLLGLCACSNWSEREETSFINYCEETVADDPDFERLGKGEQLRKACECSRQRLEQEYTFIDAMDGELIRGQVRYCLGQNGQLTQK